MKKTYLDILANIAAVPNASFSPKPRINFVEEFLMRVDCQLEKTDAAIIARAGNIGANHKLILMSHLDHPGVTIKSCKEGIFWGSSYARVITKNAHSTAGELRIPLDIYSGDGEFLGLAYVTGFSGVANENVSIEADFDVPPNSQGLWNVETHNVIDENIINRSLDNDLPTAILLSIIASEIKISYEVVFVFNLYEEVFQYSSYSLARENYLEIASEDVIINLESMKVQCR
jgi:putative aminopeptidase FrvX